MDVTWRRRRSIFRSCRDAEARRGADFAENTLGLAGVEAGVLDERVGQLQRELALAEAHVLEVLAVGQWPALAQPFHFQIRRQLA